MDWMNVRAGALELFRKYRYVFLVVIAGILLMTFPSDNSGETPLPQEVPETASENLETSLSRILSLMEGAGKVQVLLTEASGEEIRYQTDTDVSASGEKRVETVLVTGENRGQTGLICRRDSPVYQGAIILCQGADSAAVRLAIVEAVANAAGLTTDQISVLKMK